MASKKSKPFSSLCSTDCTLHVKPLFIPAILIATCWTNMQLFCYIFSIHCDSISLHGGKQNKQTPKRFLELAEGYMGHERIGRRWHPWCHHQFEWMNSSFCTEATYLWFFNSCVEQSITLYTKVCMPKRNGRLGFSSCNRQMTLESLYCIAFGLVWFAKIMIWSSMSQVN